MFKKLLIFHIFIFITTFTLGIENIEKHQKKTSKDITTYISSLNKTNNNIDLVVADIFSADEFLKNLPHLKKDKINEVLFLLPDVTLYRNNIKSISKNINKIYVVFSEKPLANKYLKNRSYIEYQKQGLINNIDNVYTFTIPIDSNIEKYIVDESIEKSVFDTQLYKLLNKYGISIIQNQ